MAAAPSPAGRPPLFRRRILIVEGFQLRFVISQLFWLAVVLVGLVALLMAPSVMAMLGSDDARRAGAADRLLSLHALVWPLVLAFFVAAAVVSIVLTHRVAGPLYRFRRVFEEVGRGVLIARVRTRRGDYLTLEAAAIDRMIAGLRARAEEIQTTVDALCAVAVRTTMDSREPGRSSAEVQKAIDAAREAAGMLVTAPSHGRAHGQGGEADLAVAATEQATRRATQDGFTLIEVLLAVGMVVVIASIGAPAYTRALEAARVTRAIGDIVAIDRDVRLHMLSNGCLPSDLAAIGRSTLIDPWGRSYVYGALAKTAGGSGGGGGRGGGGGGGGSSCGACAGACFNPGQARKDRRLVPINSDFDVYSLGRDGQSAPALTAATSQDDVVRGSDGGFVGLGRNY